MSLSSPLKKRKASLLAMAREKKAELDKDQHIIKWLKSLEKRIEKLERINVRTP